MDGLDPTGLYWSAIRLVSCVREYGRRQAARPDRPLLNSLRLSVFKCYFFSIHSSITSLSIMNGGGQKGLDPTGLYWKIKNEASRRRRRRSPGDVQLQTQKTERWVLTSVYYLPVEYLSVSCAEVIELWSVFGLRQARPGRHQLAPVPVFAPRAAHRSLVSSHARIFRPKHIQYASLRSRSSNKNRHPFIIHPCAFYNVD